MSAMRRRTAASHQGLHCLPLIQQLLDTTLGSKLYLFKFYNKYGKEFRCGNTYGIYGTHIVAFLWRNNHIDLDTLSRTMAAEYH